MEPEGSLPLTSVRHLSLSWASPIQFSCPHPTSWRSILILSTHLRLGLPSGLLPSGFPTKTLYTPSPHPYAPHAQPISFFSILSPARYWVRSTNHLAPRYLLQSPVTLSLLGPNILNNNSISNSKAKKNEIKKLSPCRALYPTHIILKNVCTHRMVVVFLDFKL